MNIETSREIRQWIKLGISGLSTCVLIDYAATGGQTIRKACKNAKEKLSKLKKKKEPEKTVDNFVNF